MAINKISKFKKEIEYGIGTLTKNPVEFMRCPSKFRNLFWIKYDNHWYLTKLSIDKKEHEEFIDKIKNQCYNLKQLEEIIINSLAILS